MDVNVYVGTNVTYTIFGTEGVRFSQVSIHVVKIQNEGLNRFGVEGILILQPFLPCFHEPISL